MAQPIMRSALTLAAAVAIGAFVTGCGSSLVPFTHELRAQHNLQKNELSNLQFYLSHKITLRRELESGSRQVTGGHKLLLTSGKTIEEVVVEEKTPGIAIAVGDHTITISFERGSSLVFAANGNGNGAALSGGSYAEPPSLDPFPGNSPERQTSIPIAEAEVFSGRGLLRQLLVAGRARRPGPLPGDAVRRGRRQHPGAPADRLGVA
jgi:hypothetical protein